MARFWVIVENAGYIGENRLPGWFGSLTEASKRMRKVYGEDEIERLHVDIAILEADGSLTYDY